MTSWSEKSNLLWWLQWKWKFNEYFDQLSFSEVIGKLVSFWTISESSSKLLYTKKSTSEVLLFDEVFVHVGRRAPINHFFWDLFCRNVVCSSKQWRLWRKRKDYCRAVRRTVEQNCSREDKSRIFQCTFNTPSFHTCIVHRVPAFVQYLCDVGGLISWVLKKYARFAALFDVSESSRVSRLLSRWSREL